MSWGRGLVPFPRVAAQQCLTARTKASADRQVVWDADLPQGIRTGPPDLQQDRGQGWGWGRVRWSGISGFPYPRLVLTLLGGGTIPFGSYANCTQEPTLGVCGAHTSLRNPPPEQRLYHSQKGRLHPKWASLQKLFLPPAGGLRITLRIPSLLS